MERESEPVYLYSLFYLYMFLGIASLANLHTHAFIIQVFQRPLDMDTTTLDHTPDCTGGTLNTLLFSAQQTLQNAKRQNNSLATSTSRPANATTTANISYRPVR